MRHRSCFALAVLGLLVLSGVAPVEAGNTYRTERIYRLMPAPGESCRQVWDRHRPRAADDASQAEKAALASPGLPVNASAELRDGLCIVTLFSRSFVPQQAVPRFDRCRLHRI
ncbi:MULTISPECIES: hypothetical protein [Bosea]|jgi:hypothetical protein|uniref:hypothetical protein n=1 Tax=Bosea TaxID=85413 RepID=UPI0006BB0A5E|nr:hypothetical protein [Bosea vaviloviae]